MGASPPDFQNIAHQKGKLTLAGVPDGYDALVLADLARSRAGSDAISPVLHVARDARRLDDMARALAFFAADLNVLTFPAWDCLPYDRMSPNAALGAQRSATLFRLAERLNRAQSNDKTDKPLVLLTTVNAMTQRVPTRAHIMAQSFSARIGESLDTEILTRFLVDNGYTRSSIVMEQGDFAVRGGIIDLFPPGADQPIRLDFFGDTLEAIRTFEPDSQRSQGQLEQLELLSAGEFKLDAPSCARFRQAYIQSFGAVTGNDPLYEAVRGQSRHQGMEHWLPLFHDEMETIFDHVAGALITFDHLVESAVQERFEQIDDYYQARVEARDMAVEAQNIIFNPLPPDRLYLGRQEWQSCLDNSDLRLLSPFELPEETDTSVGVILPARLSRNFAAERSQAKVNLFAVLNEHIRALQTQGRQVVIACWSVGSRERLAGLLAENGLTGTVLIDDWQSGMALQNNQTGLTVLGISNGFDTGEYVFITEQDVFGDKLIKTKSSRKATNFLSEAASLAPGDLVVHVDHGVGRFEGLQTITVTGAPHDCLKLVYHGDDKLFLPVENIELLSRYGPDDVGVQLDRLGSANWQNRKARLQSKLRDIADELIKIAAARQMREGRVFDVPDDSFDAFCARFPFDETDDQLDCIEAVIEDLSSGRPMDRLICGDVGFGKTEIALRAAFIVAMSGAQVAIVAPTTLLARQHARTLSERFSGLPVQIREMSRLVNAADSTATKEGLADGTIDIVVGTHALLSKTVRFANLGLVIIDEEQHFGVTHKEQLKKLRAEVHVLTLTATPIPRTLQLALTGVRDLSLIATPPVDRLAVRTYVTPFDPVIVREALLREKYRAGQSFYICPRIADLEEAENFLRENVPEVSFVTAHGQMPGADLEARMTAFYEGQYDVLLSTSIVESGLDIPTANTLVIHRGHMFGLAQLYQMRGRVGRSKLRAYAYVTYEDDKPLTAPAEKRLKVLQSLDSLGAGFTLASHDLDLRGAGNLLGEEQSGHIREVGFELYQAMLEEAVAQQQGIEKDRHWSPQINITTSVLLPEDYIEDFEVRMGLYRRLSNIENGDDVEGFAAELIDRFGPLPEAAEHLLQVVIIKGLSRQAGVEKIDTGSKGIVVQFRKSQFGNPAGLVDFINQHSDRMKVRSDHALVYRVKCETAIEMLKETRQFIASLAELIPDEDGAEETEEAKHAVVS